MKINTRNSITDASNEWEYEILIIGREESKTDIVGAIP